MTEKEQQFIQVVTIMELENHIKATDPRTGRKPKNRLNLAKAFVAKAVYNFATTDILITYLKGNKNLRTLCGAVQKNPRIDESDNFVKEIPISIIQNQFLI